MKNCTAAFDDLMPNLEGTTQLAFKTRIRAWALDGTPGRINGTAFQGIRAGSKSKYKCTEM